MIYESRNGKIAHTDNFIGRRKPKKVTFKEIFFPLVVIAIAFLVASGLHRELILAVHGGF